MFLLKRFVPIVLLLAAACEETEIIQVPTKGTLEGIVSEGSNFFGTQLLQNVSVTLGGTDPLRRVMTDAEGKFTVHDLETGTYHLIFEKPGYGTYKIQGYTFVAGNEAPIVTTLLYRLPEIKIKDLQMSITTEFGHTRLDATVYIDLPDPDTSQTGYFRYFMSATDDVSPTRYEQTDILSPYINPSVVNFNIQLNTTRFPPGTTVYMVVYPCSDTGVGYLDLETGKIIYASVSPQGSEVVATQVPM